MVESSLIIICDEISKERERIQSAVNKIMADLPAVFSNSVK